MDRERFDALVRLIAARRSRRGTLAALLGAALLGQTTGVAGKYRKGRGGGGKRRRETNRDKRPVGAEAASCASPGPSSNLKECNFAGDDLSGFELSGSNMKNTNFNGATLCGTDLSASNLKQADFRNAELTRATLDGSNGNGARFNPGTRLCRTVLFDGSIDDGDCPAGVDPEDVCCFDADCPPGTTCSDGRCALPTCAHDDQVCSGLFSCGNAGCECFFSFDDGDPAGQPYCIENLTHIFACADMLAFGQCTDTGDCEPGFSCVSSCCNVEGHLEAGFCWPVCGNPQTPAARSTSTRRADGARTRSEAVR